MAKDSDHLAGFEAEDTGGCCPAFWPRRTSSTAARCGGWAHGASARSAPWSSPSWPTRPRSGWRRDQIAAADLARQAQQTPVGGQGKPERGAAARLRHRYAEQRSRPALFARHRAGTGAGFRHRRDRQAKRLAAARAEPAATRNLPHSCPRPRRCTAPPPAVAPVATNARRRRRGKIAPTVASRASRPPASRLRPGERRQPGQASRACRQRRWSNPNR